jgi:hypothetical protein
MTSQVINTYKVTYTESTQASAIRNPISGAIINRHALRAAALDRARNGNNSFVYTHNVIPVTLPEMILKHSRLQIPNILHSVYQDVY